MSGLPKPFYEDGSVTIYRRDQFEEVPDVTDAFYCPGCNRTAEDATLPSVGCPCVKYGSGDGALPAAGVDAYLLEQRAIRTGDPVGWLVEAVMLANERTKSAENRLAILRDRCFRLEAQGSKEKAA